MENTLDIQKLPEDIRRVIFSFIISDSLDIKFRIHQINIYNEEYSRKYQVAFIGDKYVENNNGQFLSRISKPNGKHRYYLSSEYQTSFCQDCGKNTYLLDYCRDSIDCRDNIEYQYHFNTKYIGKNIDIALLELYLLDLHRKQYF